MARDQTESQGSGGQHPRGKPREHAEDLPSLGELRLVIEALKAAANPRMENRICGTGKRAGSGKPRPRQSVGKLRSVNLESAAGREPSLQGLVRSNPSSGSNPQAERAEPQGPVRTDPAARAVETRNLKRAIASGRSSRG